jgi:hypothetical protein
MERTGGGVDERDGSDIAADVEQYVSWASKILDDKARRRDND